ncbi:MAG TPA: DciA family protein [Burkholderiales bacterium]|nr:DciA family protein [Burkholderiales bacterium]
MHAKRLGEYLDLGEDTSRLVRQAALLLNIRRHLSEVLPAHLWRSCAIANYKQGVVVVVAGSSATAAKLRHVVPRAIEALGKRGLKVTGIDIEVQPGWSFPTQVTGEKALLLSPRARAALARAGCRLPDSRLKRAIDTLAQPDGGARVADPDRSGEKSQHRRDPLERE